MDNPIVLENAKPGSTDWAPTRPAHNHEIEGYASQTSALPGQSVDLYISTTAPTYTVSVYRMGWYGGAGARLVDHLGPLPGVQQNEPGYDAPSGLTECHWLRSASVAIPIDWTSGAYVFRLEAETGFQSYIPLVVRATDPHSDLLFQTSSTTYQAYNFYGGESLYHTTHTTPGRTHAYVVSYDRPYDEVYDPRMPGAGQFFLWEYHLVRWLEKNGYDVSYADALDIHAHPEMILTHKVYLSVGHNEYWSKEMRDGVEAARDHAINLMFLSANTCYWQIRFQDSPIGPNRHIVCYKDATLDPLAAADPARTTTAWRDPPIYRPENGLLGIQYDDGCCSTSLNEIDLSSESSMQAAALSQSPPAAIIGLEYDTLIDNGATPRNLEVLATSSVDFHGYIFPGLAYVTRYFAPSGSEVVACGTVTWSLGLDDWGGAMLSPPLEALTRNTLAEMVNRPVDGDLDGDGSLTIKDVVLAFKDIVQGKARDARTLRQIDFAPVQPSQWRIGDGKADIADVVRLLRAFLNLGLLRPAIADERLTVYPRAQALSPGEGFDYVAHLGASTAPADVDWSVDDPAGVVSIDSYRRLTVSALAQDGITVNVTARSRRFPTRTATAVVRIETPKQWGADIFVANNGPAAFYEPAGLAFGPNGNLYVADSHNLSIRVIDPSGDVSTLIDFSSVSTAGSPFPYGIAFVGGRLLISEVLAHRIRSVSLNGTGFKTLAGSSIGLKNGDREAAQFNQPTGLASDPAGNLYVADTGNHAIRRISLTGTVTTVAGTGRPGFDDGPGTSATLRHPYGVAWSTAGLWIADTGNHALRLLTPDGVLKTITGTGQPGDVDGLSGVAAFDLPTGVLVRPNGDVWIADCGNDAVRVYHPSRDRVDTILPSGFATYPVNRPLTPLLDSPVALVQDPSGRVYVSTRNHIVMIFPIP